MADSLDRFMEKMSKFMEDQKDEGRGRGRPVKQYPLSLTSVIASTPGLPAGRSGVPGGNLSERIIQDRLDRKAMDMLRKEEEAEEERLRRDKMENRAATLEAEVKLQKLKREAETGIDGAKGPMSQVKETVDVIAALKDLEQKMGGGGTAQAQVQLELMRLQAQRDQQFQTMMSQMQKDNNDAMQRMQTELAKVQVESVKGQVALLQTQLSEVKSAQNPNDIVAQIKNLKTIRDVFGADKEVDPQVKRIDLLIEEHKSNMELQRAQLQLQHQRWLEEMKSKDEFWKTAITAGAPLASQLVQPLLSRAAANAGAGVSGGAPPAAPAAPGPAPATPAGAPQGPVQANEDGTLKITCPTCKHMFDVKPGKATYLCPLCSTELRLTGQGSGQG